MVLRSKLGRATLARVLAPVFFGKGSLTIWVVSPFFWCLVVGWVPGRGSLSDCVWASMVWFQTLFTLDRYLPRVFYTECVVWQHFHHAVGTYLGCSLAAACSHHLQ